MCALLALGRRVLCSGMEHHHLSSTHLIQLRSIPSLDFWF